MKANNAPLSEIAKHCKVNFSQIIEVDEFASVWLVIFGNGARKRPQFVSKKKFPAIASVSIPVKVLVHPYDPTVVFVKLSDNSLWEVHRSAFSYGCHCFRVDSDKFSYSWNSKKAEHNNHAIKAALAAPKGL